MSVSIEVCSSLCESILLSGENPDIIRGLASFALRHPAEDIWGFSVATRQEFETEKASLRQHPESVTRPRPGSTAYFREIVAGRDQSR